MVRDSIGLILLMLCLISCVPADPAEEPVGQVLVLVPAGWFSMGEDDGRKLPHKNRPE